jgi:hypothetical protein
MNWIVASRARGLLACAAIGGLCVRCSGTSAGVAIDGGIGDATQPMDGSSSPNDGALADASSDVTSGGPDGGVSFTITPGSEVTVATYAQRKALGFRFGFVDGVLGGLQEEGGSYEFFGSGDTWNDAATCPGTPGTQGAYRFGTQTDSITTNFGCTALLADRRGGPPLTDGGVLGYFDRDYVGGGPVMRFTSGGRTGILMTYHAEFHWGPTCAGGAPCFYGTLGMAVSTDGGTTFESLGEIIQPYTSRPELVAMGAIENAIGAGPFVLGDANAHPVDPATADPSTTYLYVFFPDMDPAVQCGASTQCLAVARSLLSDVIAAALAHTTPAFKKFYNGGFTEPGASGDPNDAVNSGHYTPILPVAGFSPTALYDRTIKQVLLATGETDSMAIRASATLTSFPAATLTSVSDANLENRYPSLIGDDPDTMVGGASPYLFFTQVNPPGGPWSGATFKNLQLAITVSP